MNGFYFYKGNVGHGLTRINTDKFKPPGGGTKS